MLETLEQVKHAEPVPPSRLRAGRAARRWRRSALKCLEKDPREALRRGRGAGRRPAALPRRRADPGPAGPAAGSGPPSGRGGGRRSRRWSSRVHRAAGRLLLGLGIWSLRGDQSRRWRSPATRRRGPTGPRPGPSLDAWPQAQDRPRSPRRGPRTWPGRTSINRVNRAYRERADDNVALAEYLLHGCPPERRGWQWDYVHAALSPRAAARCTFGPSVHGDRLRAPTGRRSAPAARVAAAAHPCCQAGESAGRVVGRRHRASGSRVWATALVRPRPWPSAPTAATVAVGRG